MTTNVLVLGATGMLGSACYKYFSGENDFRTTGTSRSQSTEFLKCSNISDLSKILSRHKIDRIINCIGVIKPRIKEQNNATILDAILMNSIFPLELAEIAESKKIKVIQIATDCVYSGAKGDYVENDFHDAVDIYGKTKSLGEVKSNYFFNLRTSIIGRELNRVSSLLEWFLSQNNTEIQGFTNHFWNGISTYHFARICAAIFRSDNDFYGTQHLVPVDSVSKAQLLEIFKMVYERKDITIIKSINPSSINRTLATENLERNDLLWSLAGYKGAPSVAQIVKEMKEFEI